MNSTVLTFPYLSTLTGGMFDITSRSEFTFTVSLYLALNDGTSTHGIKYLAPFGSKCVVKILPPSYLAM